MPVEVTTLLRFVLFVEWLSLTKSRQGRTVTLENAKSIVLLLAAASSSLIFTGPAFVQ